VSTALVLGTCEALISRSTPDERTVIRSFAGVDLTRGPIIVAEVGNNHEGDFGLAKELVRRASDCGVDVVKFQTFRTEHYVSRSDAARFERLTRFQLSYDQFAELAALAHSVGTRFVSTPLDLRSADSIRSWLALRPQTSRSWFPPD